MMNELVSKLKAYINGHVTDSEFAIWFYSFSRVSEQNMAGKDLDFVYDIQAILAEASSGGWSHAGLLDELEMVLHTQENQVASPASVGAASH